MFIDEVKIKVIAGKGGPGAVAFSKIKMSLGPTGGSGGRGGRVILEAVSDIGALRHFQSKKVFEAEDGDGGRPSFRDGNDGADLVLKVPRGTFVTDLTTGKTFDLTKVGEQVVVVEGGKGGKGNFLFRSSRNTSPKESQPGLPGEATDLRLELKLIADIGLIGLPNIGKSSFLNTFTRADSRVGNYAFTTLSPSLGVYYDLILADIPGLIEGASEGKGLGIKFLRHIERTLILFHFVDASSTDPIADYETVRAELKKYNPVLIKKPEYVVISRSDLVSEDRVKEIQKIFAKKKKSAFPLSIVNDGQIEQWKKILNSLMEKKK